MSIPITVRQLQLGLEQLEKQESISPESQILWISDVEDGSKACRIDGAPPGSIGMKTVNPNGTESVCYIHPERVSDMLM